MEMEERKYRGLKVLFPGKSDEEINEMIRKAVEKYLKTNDEEDEFELLKLLGFI